MKFGDHIKAFLAAIIVLSLFIYGYRYYRYTQDEPDFCSSCHSVKEAYADWRNGRHGDIVCQKCHQMGNLEQNMRLISFVMTGKNPISVAHGRSKPWEECTKCHTDDIAQGSVAPGKSYGHARHATNNNMPCKECHIPNLHNFPSNGDLCIPCHEDKGVHGVETAQFSCLKCHAFSKKPVPMIRREACLMKCHVNVPKKGPMSGLSCHYCHKPHKKEMPVSASCSVSCHRTEANMGQHGIHKKMDIECLHCHKAHGWSIPEQKKKAICGSCHPFRDPKLFKYIS